MTTAGEHGRVLIVGAQSDIGRAVAHRYARAGRPLILAARNAARLATDATDIQLRHRVPVDITELDVLDRAGCATFINSLEQDGMPEIVVMVVGLLGNQAASEQDAAAAELIMRTNYLGPSLF